jgi:hypothetical protein
MGSASHCLCPCQPTKTALELESALYVARPLTGFQHLASFSPYLPPHGLELIENFAFD